jgi:hypothetical protein
VIISFKPSNTSVPVYYASVNQNIKIYIDEVQYFYNDFSLKLPEILKFVCYGIVGLSYLSCIVGLIVRKLPGL